MFMEKQIAELIYEYAKSKRPPNGYFFDTILDLLVEHWGLQDYVDKIESNVKEEVLAPITYDPLTKTITLNHYCLEDLNSEVNFYHEMFEAEEALAYYNANMVQNLLHTIEHVKQIKARESGDYSLVEAKLTQICGREYVTRSLLDNGWDYIFRCPIDLRGLEVEHEYYFYDPMERLANINSRELMVQITAYLSNIYPNLFKFEYASFIESLIECYPEAWDSKCICPTEVYFSGIGLPDAWRGLGIGSGDYFRDTENSKAVFPGPDGLYTRLRCGFPISYEEYTNYLDIVESSEKDKYTKKKNGSS